MEVPILVYAKAGKIKVLGLESSKQEHDQLLSDGWIHTHSMNACRWIENLHSLFPNIQKVLEEVASLSSR